MSRTNIFKKWVECLNNSNTGIAKLEKVLLQSEHLPAIHVISKEQVVPAQLQLEVVNSYLYPLGKSRYSVVNASINDVHIHQ